MILPGATLGMLGGGQLGRMFTVAARTLGYNVIVLDPDPDSPAGKLASDHLCADYQDTTALVYLATTCDAVSTEFENVPAATLEWLAQRCVVRPGAHAVAITQDRIHEKTFLREHGFPTAAFSIVRAEQDLEAGLHAVGDAAVLKVSRFGYDGKGQERVSGLADLRRAWANLKHEACVLEQLLPLDSEVSVVLARGADGTVVTWPVGENSHREGILDMTVVPARVSPAITREAEAMARQIAAKLEYVGVMAVEFFVSGGTLLVNEIAPRPHNSGHYTLDACVTDQFEQQVRALCGLPLGETRLLSPVVMVNLLGDLWHDGHAPPWLSLLAHPQAKLHLYGKREARPGRKMGHFTVMADSLEQALADALDIQRALAHRTPGRESVA